MVGKGGMRKEEDLEEAGNWVERRWRQRLVIGQEEERKPTLSATDSSTHSNSDAHDWKMQQADVQESGKGGSQSTVATAADCSLAHFWGDAGNLASFSERGRSLDHHVLQVAKRRRKSADQEEKEQTDSISATSPANSGRARSCVKVAEVGVSDEVDKHSATDPAVASASDLKCRENIFVSSSNSSNPVTDCAHNGDRETMEGKGDTIAPAEDDGCRPNRGNFPVFDTAAAASKRSSVIASMCESSEKRCSWLQLGMGSKGADEEEKKKKAGNSFSSTTHVIKSSPYPPLAAVQSIVAPDLGHHFGSNHNNRSSSFSVTDRSAFSAPTNRTLSDADLVQASKQHGYRVFLNDGGAGKTQSIVSRATAPRMQAPHLMQPQLAANQAWQLVTTQSQQQYPDQMKLEEDNWQTMVKRPPPSLMHNSFTIPASLPPPPPPPRLIPAPLTTLQFLSSATPALESWMPPHPPWSSYKHIPQPDTSFQHWQPPPPLLPAFNRPLLQRVTSSEKSVVMAKRLAERLRPAGLWFLLQPAAQNSQGHHHHQQSQASRGIYLRIKDGNTPVCYLRKYLVNRLGLQNEAEIEISCNGQPITANLPLQHVRDSMWMSQMATDNSFCDIRTNETNKSSHSASQFLMVLTYRRLLFLPT